MMWLRALVIVSVSVGAASPVFAEDAPWSAGVTDAQKALAQKRLEEGNARFVERDYATALERYQAAVAAWDHPAIRFNIVRCLIQLDKPIEASDNLKLALKYGAKPLEDAVYTEALNYEKLLASQIGELELKCDQTGVKVTFDGQPLPTCPHTEKRRVPPGQHQVVGTREGFLTRTVDVVIIGGKVVNASVTLDPLTKAAHVVHRYPQWLPWAVFGGGLVVAGVGGALDLQAAGQMDRYDQNVASQCADVGCGRRNLSDPEQFAADQALYNSLKSQESNALFVSKVATGVMVAGAAVAVTGGVMLFLNRGKTVYAESRETIGPQLTMVPTADGGAMATVLGKF